MTENGYDHYGHLDNIKSLFIIAFWNGDRDQIDKKRYMVRLLWLNESVVGIAPGDQTLPGVFRMSFCRMANMDISFSTR